MLFASIQNTSLIPRPQMERLDHFLGGIALLTLSLVPRPHPLVVMTNELARSVIITWHFPYNSKICSSPFECLYLFRVGWPQNVLIVARLHCRKSVR